LRGSIVTPVIQSPGGAQHRHDARGHAAHAVGAGEHLRDLRVGQTRGGTDDAVGKARLFHAAAIVDVEDRGLDQAVDPRAQGAEVGRELLREHRQHSVREVDARPPPPRFGVQRGIGLDEMGHIGDVHPQTEAAAPQLAHGDRVVEILRRFAIDRHRGRIAEALAPRGFGRTDARRELARGCQHFARELRLQTVLARYDEHVGPRIVEVPEAFEHLALGRAPVAGVPQDLDLHRLAVLRPAPE
jgi:hypothetical protein